VLPAQAQNQAPEPVPHARGSFGRLEHVRVYGPYASIDLTAKLDTGADRSALGVYELKYFLREGETWVRFIIDNGSVLPGSRLTLERPVLEDVRIKRKGGGREHRPLVELTLCVAEQQFKTAVSLSDRSSYTAPMLLGLPELKRLGSVDVAREFTHEPGCAAPTDDAPK
jgi:hypothetical protein